MQSNVLIARASGDWQRSTTTSSAATTAATINNRTNTLHQQQRRNMELCGSPVRDLQASLFPPIVTRSLATVMGDLLAVSPPSPLPPHSLRSMSQPPIIVPERMREPPPQLGSMAAAQPARWPVECQVLNEKVHHLEYTPPSPEPYYEPTNDEPQPQPVGNEAGTLVFEYHPISPVSYFTRSTVGGSRPVTPQPQGDYDGLRFESRFESGNLARAVRITPSYYELHVRADMYTNRHQQWFYFRISNTRRCTPYRLSIVNLAKAESLYNEGMKPLLYSTRDAQLHSIGWRRCGYNIAYYQNGCSCNDGDESPTYTLTFTVEFPHDKDEVYISHCYPYTYTDLQEYLNRIATHPIKSTYSTLRLLCRSLAGNNVYYLTVTSPPNILPHDSTGSPPPKTKKRSIVLTARVHPGETPASWMMKGMIDFLTGDSNQARELRDKFIFKLVPMLNPDGVIVGNNRCSLTGRDLNRQYRTVIRETYPSVWHTKLMIRRLIEECGVAMYCDLHAHSRKHNIFIYGCESRRNSERRLQEQVFPLMLHKNSADKFSFEDCKFRIHRSKEGTGRVVVWLLGVANSYTLEASFGGSQLAGRAATHFTTQDYEAVGRSFCETLLDFSDDHPSKVFSECPSHIREFIDRLLPNELLEKLRLKIISKLLKGGSSADEPTNITLSDYSSEEGDTSSSESDERNEPIQCCVSLQAPPPSPMPPKRHPRKNKIKNKPVRSPKLQREILPVYRQTLDWPTTDPGSDFYDSADERLGVSPPAKHIGRIRTRYGGDGYRSDWGMPPELTVISGNGGPIRQRSQSVIDITLTDKQSKPSWHRIRSLPPSRTIKPQPAEVEVKLTSLRQRIWTGMGIGTDSPISWGMSVLAATAYQNDCEALLRSCSQKLFAFKKQNGDLRKDSDGHKKVKKKSKVIKAPIVIDENNILKPKTSKKKLQKLTRQKTISEVRPDPPKFERPPVRQKTITEMKLDPIKLERIPIRPSTSGPASTGKLKKQRTVLQSQEKESDNEDTSAKRTVKKKKKRKKT